MLVVTESTLSFSARFLEVPEDKCFISLHSDTKLRPRSSIERMTVST